MQVPLEFQRLYATAESVAAVMGSSAEGAFDPCGLILENPPLRQFYWCTPANARTFASTGGDGVHYSFLEHTGAPEHPIVMTLPAADKHNLVVAEGLAEFLGLGFHVGWFALEQVLYQPSWAEGYFSRTDADADTEKEELLEVLRSSLDIRPVTLSAARVSFLTAKYAHLLEVPDDPPET